MTAGVSVDRGVQVLTPADAAPVAIVASGGKATIVVGPSIGAEHRSMCRVRLDPGGETIMLRHPGEAVWYVVEGTGRALAEDGSATLDLDPGAMVHVGPDTGYRIVAGTAMVLLGGPAPPDPELEQPSDGGPAGAQIRLFHRDRPGRLVPMISSDARLVVFAGVGAETANMNYVKLEPGEENMPHSHSVSEDTIVILSGAGTAEDLSSGYSLGFVAGDVVHVPVGVEHRVKADRGVGIESVGGPCPADRAMLAAMGSA